MAELQLPTTYSDPIPLAIIGGTGLSSLPSPPFTPLALLPPTPTPWGLPSSPIAVLAYTSPTSSSSSSSHSTTIAFLARHGLTHDLAPHEVPYRANVATLKRLGVVCAVGFSAVGSLRREVQPRDFVVVDQLIDWTKGLRPRTFFEHGVVGHTSLAEPFDPQLSALVATAIGKPGVLHGDNVSVHSTGTVICIEGPHFSTRAESRFFTTLAPPSNPLVINMSACPEAHLFAEAAIAYALVCMSTDYDSWLAGADAVSVDMVMGHMAHNAGNARRALEAVMAAWSGEGEGGKWGRGEGGEGVVTKKVSGEARERLAWLFGEKWKEA